MKETNLSYLLLLFAIAMICFQPDGFPGLVGFILAFVALVIGFLDICDSERKKK